MLLDAPVHEHVMYSPETPRGTSASLTDVDRDWLGRRNDLKEFHRDPACRTHTDPFDPCSCRRLFREWDRTLDWAFCIGIVLAILVLTLTLSSVFGPTT